MPQGSILGPLLFLFYINDLPQLVKDIALPILYADDTSFIIVNSNSMNMNQDLKLVLEITQKWFKSNIMLLNYYQTTSMHFFSNISYRSVVNTQSTDCKINLTNSIKFLGITIDSSLTWNKHIDRTNSKLNSLGYILRSLRSVLSLKIIKQIYNSYVHSVLNYGIIFWGNLSYSRTIFITQKRIVRIIMKTKARDSCRAMFSKLGILTLYSQYIFSILMFIVKHKNIFTFNIELHKINTRQKQDLHVPSVNLTKVQKGVYYSGITLFNSLPFGIKKVTHNTNKFKHVLKKFLIKNSF